MMVSRTPESQLVLLCGVDCSNKKNGRSDTRGGIAMMKLVRGDDVLRAILSGELDHHSAREIRAELGRRIVRDDAAYADS